MTEVAVCSALPGRAEAMLAARFLIRVHRGPALTGEDELVGFIGAAAGAVTLLANPVSRRVLERCPGLRVVGNVAVGYDNVDVAAAAERGVWVTNTPDVLTEATADLAWALVLAVTRRLGEAERFLREGRFRGWALDLLLGTGLQGKRIGIVGYGRIGRAVARRALAAGMEIACSDRQPIGDAVPPAAQLPLDELLATSAVVSLHAPLDASTRHLLDERRLRSMPRGAVLVNTSRGPLVDEAALVRVLESGHLGGAGLDVYEHEPEVHPGLLGRRDVVLLPHVGSATLETRAAMAELAASNVIAALEGGEPPTPVVRGK
ncbi:MAG TPA: D-glycerate dehydrogenase [Thermoanaerobaculales bacterium]|nr:D-glycerate dehydrogenase [Thermoanaerobaculales bacterium]HQL30626.1 D-glycerate dehydrogenase [Thermoanaerobaculales bacterium]